MSNDKLTKDERQALARSAARLIHGSMDGDLRTLVAALERVAPAPKPPEPRLNDVIAEMRSCGGGYLEYAHKLEAALRARHNHRSEMANEVMRHINASPDDATRAAYSIVGEMLNGKLMP